MTDRYVLLGLARPDREWFRIVAHWATTARLPIEFVKCVSATEAHARLGSRRRFSALLLDPGAHGADRDLVDRARSHGLAVIAVDDPRLPRQWRAFGVSAVIPRDVDPDDLLAVLEDQAVAVPRVAAPAEPPSTPSDPGPLGRVVTVVGRGGTGASVVALTLAQGLARDHRPVTPTLLADFALHGDQALLHHVGDVVPGLPELVEAHRLGVPDGAEVDRLAHTIADRGYDLVLGLRRHRDWTRLRRRAVEQALLSLRRRYEVVVLDADADVEGERDCGSDDVENRNVLARTAVGAADLVLVVTPPTLTGLRGTVTVIDELADRLVPADRILPVVNRSPRRLSARAEITRTLAQLAGSSTRPIALPSPLHLARRRGLDGLLRDAAPMPTAMSAPLARSVTAMLAQLPPRGAPADEPVPVVPGSLGHWHEADTG